MGGGQSPPELSPGIDATEQHYSGFTLFDTTDTYRVFYTANRDGNVARNLFWECIKYLYQKLTR